MTSLAPSELSQALARYRLRAARANPSAQIEYLEAGAEDAPVSHVLLHGIGSSAASWIAQLHAADQNRAASRPHVLAWNAPGYGASTALTPAEPLAEHYAARLWQWLDEAGIKHAFTLVGQSMGCLIAAAAARQRPSQITRLVLFAPARGYGRASEAERIRRRDERLAALHEHGPTGLAERRGAAMLSTNAPAEMISYIRSIMSRVNPGGYTQATHMLSRGDIDTDLSFWKRPLVIASGTADTITPATGCKDIAARAGIAWTDLGEVGHGCPLEAARLANAILGLV